MRAFTFWGAVGGAVVSLAMLGGSGSIDALAQPVPASANRFTLTLERQAEESYATLERRAEAAARAATQRTFDSDILVRSVVVTIVAENRGLVAPVLTLQATREQWRQLPDPQRWSTYYPSAQALLQLSPAAPSPTAIEPAAVPPPADGALPAVAVPEQVPGAPVVPGQ